MGWVVARKSGSRAHATLHRQQRQTCGAHRVELPLECENRDGFIEHIKLPQVAQRFLPGAVGGFDQNVPPENGLAVIGSTGALRNVGQNRTELRQHHGPADMRAAGRELEAECLQRC
jgi:hypothetical protein